MRFGSVCSGIEAASVAWQPLGWKAAWLSEIEPFPSAVLAHHYPDVPNLGDMTTLPERILSGEVEAPDLFCGGTPCQAFSVAGLRNSLDDARGNLSLTFVGIANAIDHVRSARGEQSSIIFWENVPGVLSTKDNAFGCFLAGLAGEEDPVEPPRGKWTNAGVVLGPQRAVAWRVLDAQYFGVAQRRRRVFVVASARADFNPAAVLFEFDGVRRDTAPSREAREEVASGARTGAAVSSHWDGDYPHPTLNQSAKGSGGVGSSNQEIFSQRGAYLAPAKGWPADIASTLDTTFGTKQGLEDQHVNAGCPLFVPAQTFSTPAIGHIVEDDVASTMTKNTGGGGETQNPAFVAQPIPLNSMNVLRSADADPTTGCGIGEAGEAMFTLTKGKHHAVAQPISIQDVRPVEKAQNGKGWNDDGTAYTVDTHATQGVAQVVGALACNTGPNGHDAGNFACNQAVDAGHVLPVAQPMILMDQGGSVMNVEHDMVGTLRRETHGHEPVVMQPMAFVEVGATLKGGSGERGYPDPSDGNGHNIVAQAVATVAAFKGGQGSAAGGIGYDEHVAPTLSSADSGSNRTPALLTAMQVRRLTPVECERLQGFPDNYTNIPWRKKDESPDGPRYKALGNSWAVPNVRWIGQRIADHINPQD